MFIADVGARSVALLVRPVCLDASVFSSVCLLAIQGSCWVVSFRPSWAPGFSSGRGQRRPLCPGLEPGPVRTLARLTNPTLPTGVRFVCLPTNKKKASSPTFQLTSFLQSAFGKVG